MLEVDGLPGGVHVSTDAEVVDAARERSSVVFDGGEWQALVAGAEADRIWPRDFGTIVARKATQRDWSVDLDVALAGARPEPARGWTVARVLARLGARIVSVCAA